MSHCGVSSTTLRIILSRGGETDEAPGVGPFPEPALSTIGSLTRVCKEAHRIGGFLCGGAIRDYLLMDKPCVKDFDIFVPVDGKVREPVDLSLFGHAIEMPKDFIDKTRDEVLGIDKYPGVSVDVIFIDRLNVLEIVETFDATVCEVWVEWVMGEPQVFCSAAFSLAMSDGDWYTYSDVPTTNDHTRRLTAKFGEPRGSITSTRISPIPLGPLRDVRGFVKALREKLK